MIFIEPLCYDNTKNTLYEGGNLYDYCQSKYRAQFSSLKIYGVLYGRKAYLSL